VSETLIVLIPLLVLVIMLLFPFVGCVGEDPEQAYERGKKEEAERQEEERKIEKEAEASQKAAAEEERKYQNVVLKEADLVSYWRLSEGEVGDLTAKDSAPDLPKNGQYKNVAAGGVIRGVQGVLSLVNDPLDKAAQFDGVQGYVEVPHDGLINPVLEFSVELWVKPTALSAQPQVVLGSYEVDATGKVVRGFVIDVFTDATEPRVRARVGNGTGFTPIEASLESGAEHDAWRHVVVTYSGATKVLRLYVNADNGIFDAQVPPPTQVPPEPVFYVANQSSSLRIGAGQVEGPTPSPNPGQFFEGLIDEVALYRVPLDGSQVKNHFQRATALLS
jgi:hypothetical protein